MYEFIAKFSGCNGRYAVNRDGFGYEGQRVLDKRQEKYGNKPDSQGLYLDEMLRWFDGAQLLSLKPIAAASRTSRAAK